MKDCNGFKIIGVDHGFGNMKTANHCFPTGLLRYDSEPLFTKDLLVYDGGYYLIGEGRKEFLPDFLQLLRRIFRNECGKAAVVQDIGLHILHKLQRHSLQEYLFHASLQVLRYFFHLQL